MGAIKTNDAKTEAGHQRRQTKPKNTMRLKMRNDREVSPTTDFQRTSGAEFIPWERESYAGGGNISIADIAISSAATASAIS